MYGIAIRRVEWFFDWVCKVFVEIRTTPIVGAGLRGMPKGIRTVDLVLARCMARPAQWRGTGTPPIGVNLSTQLPDCLLWEGFISPIYMYLSGLKTPPTRGYILKLTAMGTETPLYSGKRRVIIAN